jgi:hypothetical protein
MTEVNQTLTWTDFAMLEIASDILSLSPQTELLAKKLEEISWKLESTLKAKNDKVFGAATLVPLSYQEIADANKTT